MAKRDMGTGLVRRNNRGPSVGTVFVQRVGELLTILGGEPKHSLLDQHYLAVKEVYERMIGVPARETGRFTAEGERLIVPPQPEADPDEPFDRDPIVPVPASHINEHGEVEVPVVEVPVQEKGDNASSEQGAASSNGDSGASSGQIVLP